MADPSQGSYGSRFYRELRRLSGFDFVELSYEDIQRLKLADRELAITIAVSDQSWKPRADASPEEFAAEFVKRAASKQNPQVLMIFDLFRLLWFSEFPFYY